jgi:CrcB protein
MNAVVMMLVLGALGVWARYEFQSLAASLWPANAAFGTFFINLLGSFLMGGVYVLSVEKAQISDDMRLAVMVGFLGGFTTFSSYSLESIRLLEAGQLVKTFVYVALCPALSIVLCFLGMVAARRFG